MRIIALSRCLGYSTQEERSFDFHFKGIFYGRKIEKIRIEKEEYFFEEKVDYVLDLKLLGFKEGILLAKVRRSRKLWS